jgi:hypothetical protein
MSSSEGCNEHKVIMDAIQRIYNETGIRVISIHASWINTSTATSSNYLVREVNIESISEWIYD